MGEILASVPGTRVERNFGLESERGRQRILPLSNSPHTSHHDNCRLLGLDI